MAKVVFITGVSSGIGQATALAFAREGVHVAGTARRTERLQALAASISALPQPHGDFLAITADVTDAAAMQAAVAATIERFGRLDILVANAGIGQRGAIADAEWSHIEAVLRTNIDGVLHSVRACVPAMRQAGGGHIFTISSVMYNLTAPYAATYAASKAAVTSLSHALRLELQPDNIRVTDVLVGRTHTEFNEKRLGAGKRTGSSLPTMSPEQVAAAIVKATAHNRATLTLRLFDRLIVWGSILAPGILGRLAQRQYK